MDSDFKAAETV